MGVRTALTMTGLGIGSTFGFGGLYKYASICQSYQLP